MLQRIVASETESPRGNYLRTADGRKRGSVAEFFHGAALKFPAVVEFCDVFHGKRAAMAHCRPTEGSANLGKLTAER